VEPEEHTPAEAQGLADAGSLYWTEVRRLTVDRHMAKRGIRDPRVLEAMRTVPRHVFVPLPMRASAYEDRPLDIGQGQTISQPYMVAHMTEQLRLRPEDRVLEIGTGSGYQAAVLAVLAREVFSVERYEELARGARMRLDAQGLRNVTVLIGDGTRGCPEHAPYDAIVVTAAAPRLPEALLEQLAVGGRLVCPVGGREYQSLMRVTRREDGFVAEEGIHCMFVPLIGEQGWPEK
jgi:protein-L-isoaspartate(D-aspartate) O-methyltransferase